MSGAGARWRRWWWRLPHVIWLTALWALLWGDLAPGVLLAGAAVGVVVSPLAPRQRDLTHTLRPWAAARFAATVATDMVRANLALTVEVLTPTDRTRPGHVEVRLPSGDPALVTATTQAVNLAPGTVVVDQPAADRLVVHALHLTDPDRVRSHIEHLAALADAALVSHPTR